MLDNVYRWTRVVDDTVWLTDWNHSAHEFENGTCAYCGMTITDGLIGTPAELLALMNTPSLWGKSYKLTADINLSGYTTTNLKTQKTIGNASTKFTGSFNGNGYTVSGVAISGTTYTGFFGITDGATIKNLTLEGTVTGTSYTGGFIGDARISTGASTTIDNCVSNLTVTSTGTDMKYTGGIVGIVRYMGDNASITIKNCVNNKAVTGVSSVGGIVGYVWSNTSNDIYFSECSFSISNCYNYGNVKATDNSAGGMIASFLGARNKFDVTTSMTELYNAGAVTVTNDKGYHGAIIGIFRVPKLDEKGKAPVKIADIQNTSGTIGLIGNIANPNGIFSIARAYNTSGVNIITANPGIVNTNAADVITDSFGYSLLLIENCNKDSTATELNLLRNSDKWVADENNKPELEFVHEHDFTGDGICSCSASVLDGEIEFPEEIIFLMNNQKIGTTNLWAKSYKLVKNIDLTGYENQKPIGDSTAYFSGTFDGNGYTISGVNINTSTKDTGFFGRASGATIKNLTLRGKVTSTSGNDIAGFVGYGATPLTIQNCVNHIDVTASLEADTSWVGGFVGYASLNSNKALIIDNCTNYGDITAFRYLGGIVGGNAGTATGITVKVTNCKNYGNITSAKVTDANVAGGIYGFNRYAGTSGTNTFEISKCANYGNVTAYIFAGGILGAHFNWLSPSSTTNYALNTTLSELLNTGIVTGVSADSGKRVGGIVGYLGILSENISITAQHWMHAGSTVLNGAQVDHGVIGKVGSSATTTESNGFTTTFKLNGAYNKVGTVAIAIIPEYVTLSATYWRDIDNSASGLMELLDNNKDYWVNEGTTEAPKPMLKAFHEHDFASGTCACGIAFDYAISNVEEMLIYMHNPSLWSHNCVLDANITLTGVAGQNPVGTETTPFTGTFDGKNFTVTGLNIYATEVGAGLFGVVKNATIKNINLVDPIVSGTDGAGALIGTAYAPITVSGCTVTNANVTAANYNAGGVIGDILFSAASKTASVTNCTTTGGNITTIAHAGGIIGRIRTATDRYSSTTAVTGCNVTVSNCTSSATVYADHYDQADVGGIVGRITVFSNDNTFTVSGNENTGTVSGTTCIGGIIGRLNVDDNDSTVHLTGNQFTVSENTNSGAITASYDFAGGIAGVINNQEDTALTFSGKAGVTTNSGTITAGAYAGGVMGAYYNRGYFTATKTQTVTLLKNTGAVTAKADDDYAGSQASRSAGGIFGLISTTSTPITLSVFENHGNVHAEYSYAGGVAGYIRSYGNGKASLTLTDSRVKGTVTTNYKYAGGIVGYAAGNGPLKVYYNASLADVSGGESSDSSTVNACFGGIGNNSGHDIHSNFYAKSALQAGDKALYLNPATNTSTTVAVAVEKMVARDEWVVGAGAVPYLEAFTNSCGSGHVENEGDGWIWHYDSSAKQYYLTCKACGADYAHQDEAPTLYVGSSLLVGIDTNIGTTPATRLRTLEEAARRLVETGGTIRISGGIAIDADITLPDWGNNTITFTSDETYHDSNGAVTTGLLIKKMDVQLKLGGKAIFDDILFKANDTENYRIIISANWHDIDMRYIRAQNNARCYLLAGMYGESSTSENIEKPISTTVNIEGPALADSQTIGYFYERIYLGSAPVAEDLTYKNKTVTLNVQDGYANSKATSRTQPALIYFLYAMSTADRTQKVFTDGCTSNIYFNENSMVHAFSTGSRNVGEAGAVEFDKFDADGNVIGTETVTFTDGDAYLDNLNIYFNDNSNIVDGLDKNGDGDFKDSGEIEFVNLGRFYVKNAKNTVIKISDEDGIDEYTGEGTRTEPLIHRMFFFRNGTFDASDVTAKVSVEYGRHGFLASFGDDVIFEEGSTGNINTYNYTVTEYVDPECDWDEGVVTKKPTPTTNGTIKYTCIECGRTRTETLTHSHEYVVKANGTYYCYDFDGNKVWTECSLAKPTTPVIIAATPKTASNNSVTVDVTITATTAIAGSKFVVDKPDGFVLKSATVKLPDTSTGTGLTAVTSGGTTTPYTVALVQNPAADAKVAKTVVLSLTFDVSAVDHTSNAHIVRVYDAASYNLAETSIATTAVSAEVIVNHEYDYVWEKTGSTYYIPCLVCGEKYKSQTTLPTVYVDQTNGNDTANDGLTSAKAVKTLKEAVHRLHKVSGHIKIVGEYNLSSHVTFAEDWVNTIYIEGGTINIKKDAVKIVQRGNLKYDGVTFVGEVAEKSDIIFEAAYHNLTMQNISANTYARSIVCAGEYYPTADNTATTTSKVKLYGVTNGENAADYFYNYVVLGSWIKDGDTRKVENKTVELETVDNGTVATKIKTLHSMSCSVDANVTGVTTSNCNTTVNLNDNTELYQFRTGSTNVNGYKPTGQTTNDTSAVVDRLTSLTLNFNGNSHTIGGTIDITNVLNSTVNVSLESEGRTTPLATDITFYMNGTVKDETTTATVNYGTHSFATTITDPVNQGATATKLTVTENVTVECTDGYNDDLTDWADYDDTDDALHYRTCEVCGKVFTAKHSFTNWAPVSGDNTSHSRTCATCSYTQTREHTLTKVVTAAVDPTCTATGKTAVMGCMHCSYTEGGETVPALGHAWSDWADVDGTNHSRKCSVCGETESGMHSYATVGEHPYTSSGTTTWTKYDENQHSRTCGTCGYVHYSRHSMTKTHVAAVNPTPTTPGTTAVIMCDVCEHTKGGETVYYLIDENVKFSAHVTLLSEYVLEYIIPKDDKVTDCYMVFTYIENGVEKTAKVYPTNVEKLTSPEDVKDASYDATKNYFEAPPIAAKEMADVIKGDYYYLLDGVLYKSNTRPINLISYYKAVKQLNPANAISTEVGTALVNVLDAMFNYGAAAQTYFGYNTEKLVTGYTKGNVVDYTANTSIDQTVANLGMSGISGEAVSGQLYSLHGQAANLEQRIATVLYFEPENGTTVNANGITFKGGFMNVTGAWVAIESTAQKVNVNGTDLIAVYIDRPAAKDLRVEFSGALYSGNTQVSPEITTSFELYAADIINTSEASLVANKLATSDTNATQLKAVCRAMLAYSDAAANYFNLYWDAVNLKNENK